MSHEESLNELFHVAFETPMLGSYFHTWPNSPEQRNIDLHAAMTELERQKRVKRHLNLPGHVIWVKA